jgi:transposase
MTVAESHQKTYVIGTLLTIHDKQLSYVRELKRKFYKLLILFLDRAPPQHCRSKRVRAYLERNDDDDVMTIEYYLPKGSPETSAVEECWKQGEDDLLVSK